MVCSLINNKSSLFQKHVTTDVTISDEITSYTRKTYNKEKMQVTFLLIYEKKSFVVIYKSHVFLSNVFQNVIHNIISWIGEIGASIGVLKVCLKKP